MPSFEINALSDLAGKHASLKALLDFGSATHQVAERILTFKDSSCAPATVCSDIGNWRAMCKRLVAAVPSLDSALTPVQVKVQHLADDFYTARLRLTLQTTAKLIAMNITRQSLEMDVVKSALESCDQAAQLATGLSDPESRAQTQNLVEAARNILSWQHHSSAGQNVSAISSIKRLATTCSLRLPDAGLADFQFAINDGTHEYLNNLFLLLFGDASSARPDHVSSMVSVDVFKSAVVLWQKQDWSFGGDEGRVLLCVK